MYQQENLIYFYSIILSFAVITLYLKFFADFSIFISLNLFFLVIMPIFFSLKIQFIIFDIKLLLIQHLFHLSYLEECGWFVNIGLAPDSMPFFKTKPYPINFLYHSFDFTGL